MYGGKKQRERWKEEEEGRRGRGGEQEVQKWPHHPNAPQTKKQPGPDARFSFSSRVEMKLGPSDLGHQGKAAKGLQGGANQH